MCRLPSSVCSTWGSRGYHTNHEVETRHMVSDEVAQYRSLLSHQAMSCSSVNFGCFTHRFFVSNIRVSTSVEGRDFLAYNAGDEALAEAFSLLPTPCLSRLSRAASATGSVADHNIGLLCNPGVTSLYLRGRFTNEVRPLWYASRPCPLSLHFISAWKGSGSCWFYLENPPRRHSGAEQSLQCTTKLHSARSN